MFPIAMVAMIAALAGPIVTAQDRPTSPNAKASPAETTRGGSDSSGPSTGRAGKSGKPSGRMVNINTATVAELSELPGVGAKTAERIVEYRQKNGQFKKAEDLMNVRGIGEKSFLKMKPQIAVAATR
jgi:competence protein ComEA